MGPVDLIDTTEMYLKTVFEMEEDGVLPMRARIVERLGHSGPTVSQTVARMERDGLLVLTQDRRLELTTRGREMAREVMRKHRLAECLLIEVIGLDWAAAHEEACRWEHVMSDDVEQKLVVLLQDPRTDPYGNPIPGTDASRGGEVAVEALLADSGETRFGTLARIGEPVQADREALQSMKDRGIVPGVAVGVKMASDGLEIWLAEGTGPDSPLGLSSLYLPHLFLESRDLTPIS